MNFSLRLITRIALFASLVYVLSWATVYLPNVSLIFFLVFLAGYLWGGTAGFLVGAIGEALWTIFNPYGPAALPIMVVQTLGAALSGIVGAFFHNMIKNDLNKVNTLSLVIASIFCTLLFYLPVTVVDAWLFQPFWVRIITGLPWVGISIVSNAIIFPLLFTRVVNLYVRRIDSRHI